MRRSARQAKETRRSEAKVRASRHNQVVDQIDVQRLSCGRHRVSEGNVLSTRLNVTRRVVVAQHESGSIVRKRMSKYLSRRNSNMRKCARRHRNDANQAHSRVKQKNYQRFHIRSSERRHLG
jgi:hypothetical protein